MQQHKFRASSLGEIMTDAKSKDEILSVGAKTAIEKLAKELAYGYDEQISSKYMEKGIAVEDQAIELVNSVFFTNYKKNTERKSNEWITGECDIATPTKIIDIKSSWSLATFPAIPKSGESKLYEWQGRAYMWLWDVDFFEVNYCLVNTPDELIGYEDQSLHYVDHIAPEMRVTRLFYERDKALELKMQQKVEAARIYMEEVVKQIATTHNY
jgi:hypothetical protein